MLAYYAKRSLGEEFEQLRRPISSGMWVNGTSLSDAELDELVKTYGLEPNIVRDIRDRQELPRVEAKGDDLYVFLRVPRLAKSGHVVSSPLLCVVRPGLFFSLSMSEGVAPEAINQSSLPVTATNTADLLLTVVAACVSAYQELLKHTERSINDTGARLRTHEVTNSDFIHFVVVEDNLTSYHMNLGGIQTVVQRLASDPHLRLKKKSLEGLDDIELQINQLLVVVQSYSGRVESIRNAYSTIANNTLNRRIKTLTILTVLITLPNVVYGMYGMNVGLPFADEPWAYAAIVTFSLLFVTAVYLIAKKAGFFR